MVVYNEFVFKFGVCAPYDVLKMLQEFVQIPAIDFNDKLRLASSWFGMCRIASQLSPIPEGGGIKLLQADAFDLHSFHTLTGTTFMMVASPGLMDCAEILQST